MGNIAGSLIRKNGRIVKWYGTSTDLDDGKRAEETLRETETRFGTYINHATDAFCPGI